MANVYASVAGTVGRVEIPPASLAVLRDFVQLGPVPPEQVSAVNARIDAAVAAICRRTLRRRRSR